MSRHLLPTAKSIKAAGVLFSLLLFLSCSGGKKKAETDNGLSTNSDDSSLLLEETTKGNSFLIDTLSEDKIGSVALGTIGEGEVIEGSFEITNGFSEPLVILSVRGSCGCLSPEIDKAPIMPLDRRKVTFLYDSKGKHGRQISAILLKSDKSRYRVEIDVTVRSN